MAGMPECGEIQAGQRGGALPVQELLPYRPRRMDPSPFPPSARGRRGRGGNYPFANNDRNRPGANWRNHPDLEEQEEHREEVLPRPYRAEPRIDYAQPEQGQNLLPINALNDVGALQRMIREMMEPEPEEEKGPPIESHIQLTLIRYPYPQVSKCQTSLYSTERIHMLHQLST
ncbi:unnamed protein product [Prunus brigantina]